MISREEARLILCDMYNSCIDGYTNLLAEDKEVPAMLIDDINALDMAIEALSTERPKGRWNPISADRVRCTNCDAIRDITTQLFWDFCPNCGSDNRGEEE